VIKTLPAQSKLILIAILLRERQDAKKGSVSPTTTGEVYEIYKDLCKKTRTDSITQRRVADLISELDMLGIITARVISKGRYGRTREIKLSTNADEILRIIKEDEVYADLSNYKISAQTRLI
jgi:cell division control protein 6